MIKSFLDDLITLGFLFLLGLILVSSKAISPAFANFGIQGIGNNNSPAPIVSPSDGVSRNWAGYIAQNGSYTAISGSWIVPQIGDSSNGADAAWVGIGGVSSQDLIQAGTQGTVSRNGQASYEAFYETLPDVSHPLRISVNGGDSVFVSVVQQSDGSWSINFKDNSNGQRDQVTTSYNSSLSSAEWIEEAPSGSRNILPLDNFGTINFSGGATVKNGQTESIVESGATPVNMGSNQGQILATTSDLGSDGSSFSVTRTSAPSISSNGPTVRRMGRRGFGGYGNGDGDDNLGVGFGFRVFHFRF